MSIAPPSDILLDAARAADPAKVQAATARLARLATDPAAADDGFAAALADAKASAVPARGGPASLAAGAANLRAPTPATAATYQKFEALLLQTFVESMLPKDDELFGDKNSAGVYRSMMAEQFANQIAKAGGIGIAKAVASAHPGSGASAAPIAPTPATPTSAAPIPAA